MNWKHYRLDFNTTGTAKAPTSSFEWDAADFGWRRRIPADKAIDLSDAYDYIQYQMDTASTDIANNTATSVDINWYSVPVENSSTATMGGRFDTTVWTSTSGVSDGARRTITATNPPRAIRGRMDNNTTLAGYMSVFVSFKTKFD